MGCGLRREGRKKKKSQGRNDLTWKRRGKTGDKKRGYYTAWEGDESHVTVVMVAGPGRPKGSCLKTWNTLEGRLYKSQMLIMIKWPMWGLLFSSTMLFLNMPRNFSWTWPYTSHLQMVRPVHKGKRCRLSTSWSIHLTRG